MTALPGGDAQGGGSAAPPFAKKHRRKFAPGKVLTTVEVYWSVRDGYWLYLHNRPVHPSIIDNMTMRTVRQLAMAGKFREALRSTP